jgi:hypothetical protein
MLKDNNNSINNLNLKVMAYVHFYEFYKRVSRSRRKELAKFVHELKKLCGRKYHTCVVEMLENCNEDYVFVECDTTKDNTSLMEDINGLCNEYGIPMRNVVDMCSQIEISLYTDV